MMTTGLCSEEIRDAAGRLIKVRGAVCEDQVRRVAVVTGGADRFGRLPARVQAKGSTVTGFLRSEVTPDGARSWSFTAFKDRLHAHLLTGSRDI